jgi:hypothetical protein
VTYTQYFKRDRLRIFDIYKSTFNRQTNKLQPSLLSRNIRHIWKHSLHSILMEFTERNQFFFYISTSKIQQQKEILKNIKECNIKVPSTTDKNTQVLTLDFLVTNSSILYRFNVVCIKACGSTYITNTANPKTNIHRLVDFVTVFRFMLSGFIWLLPRYTESKDNIKAYTVSSKQFDV